MKYLLFILLVIGYSVKGQQSTKEPGDSIWLTSDDTAKVKVYKSTPNMGNLLPSQIFIDPRYKYVDCMPVVTVIDGKWVYSNSTVKDSTPQFDIKLIRMGDGTKEPTPIFIGDSIIVDYLIYRPLDFPPDTRNLKDFDTARGIVFHPPLYWTSGARYDTVGDWHLVTTSDTIRGHFIQVGLMFLYEIREYERMASPSLITRKEDVFWINPKTIGYLDYNKKQFKYLVIKIR
jgi:hypothetical protein